MAAPKTLLCIHRDPAQLNFLQEAGYGLITAINGNDGLRLLMSRPVDAIVIEYYLGLLNGADVAYEIKRVKPQIPIVMMADHLEMSEGELKWVDAFVAKSDGSDFLLTTIHSVLQTRVAELDRDCGEESRRQTGRGIPKASKHQILVVDDDPAVRETTSLLLMAGGYDVVAAEDGFAALVQLKKTPPDVMISDLDMPGMSGFELLSVVRRRFPELLTLAVSGAYTGEELPFGVVADAFLTKGTQSVRLFSTLRELLHTAPARRTRHYRELAPAWIPCNGNDSQGLPYVMLFCPECLRAFQMNIVEEVSGVLEIPCRFCPSTNKYIIQPARDACHLFA